MKNNIIIASVSLIVGLAFGYWFMPSKEITKTVEKQVDKVITVIKRPDGTIEKTITDKSKIITENTEKINERKKILSVSALVGNFGADPVYGMHLSKEFFGPLTLGVWGTMKPSLSNTNVGVSIGVTF